LSSFFPPINAVFPEFLYALKAYVNTYGNFHVEFASEDDIIIIEKT